MKLFCLFTRSAWATREAFTSNVRGIAKSGVAVSRMNGRIGDEDDMANEDENEAAEDDNEPDSVDG